MLGRPGRRRAERPRRRRGVACIRSCFRLTPLSLSQKGWTRLKSAMTTARSPDPLTRLAATLDPTAQMGFPRLLPDRTREIADGIGSAHRGEQLSPWGIHQLLVHPGSPVGRYRGMVVVTFGVDPEAVTGYPVPLVTALV